MTSHGSATLREEKPHVTQPARTNTTTNALRRRAQAVLNDRTIDPQTRVIIRYALEINDPWLGELVRRVDAGEAIVDDDGNIVDTIDFSQEPEIDEQDSSEEKIRALAEILCRPGDEPESKAAALLVLMGTLESSSHAKALVNMAKHFVFTRCGELNLYGMVDAQVAVVESELLATDTLTLARTLSA